MIHWTRSRSTLTSDASSQYRYSTSTSQAHFMPLIFIPTDVSLPNVRHSFRAHHRSYTTTPLSHATYGVSTSCPPPFVRLKYDGLLHCDPRRDVVLRPHTPSSFKRCYAPRNIIYGRSLIFRAKRSRPNAAQVVIANRGAVRRCARAVAQRSWHRQVHISWYG